MQKDAVWKNLIFWKEDTTKAGESNELERGESIQRHWGWNELGNCKQQEGATVVGFRGRKV